MMKEHLKAVAKSYDTAIDLGRKQTENKEYYMKKTLAYYSKWIGQDDILEQKFNGVEYIYFDERNKILYGYGQSFDIYIFVMENKAIVSYGDKAKPKIEKLKNCLKNYKSIEDLKDIVKKVYNREVAHNIKYVFNGTNVNDNDNIVKMLGNDDYKKYEEFFQKCNPGCSNIDWLQEYFDEMVMEHMCIGAIEDDILVSCTEAPGMPYMPDEVQEIGINTLSDYRGKGYATVLCQSCANEIIKNGKVPQWSTAIDNVISQKLAERVGFVKLADVITVTI